MQFPELTEEEKNILDTGEDAIEEEVVVEKKEEDKKEETTEVEKKEEAEEKEEVKIPEAPVEEDKSAAARYRFEASEAKRETARLKAENEELKKSKEKPAEDQTYEEKVDTRMESTEERLERLEKERDDERKVKEEQDQVVGALQEIDAYGNKYKESAPDFDDARKYLRGMIATSLKVVNPGIDKEALAKSTLKKEIEYAAQAYADGVNVAQALYKHSVAFGYTKKEEVEETEEKEEKKSNLAKLAVNKKKSTNMPGTGSGSKVPTTKEALNDMTTAEFSKQRLTPEELDELLYA